MVVNLGLKDSINGNMHHYWGMSLVAKGFQMDSFGGGSRAFPNLFYDKEMEGLTAELEVFKN